MWSVAWPCVFTDNLLVERMISRHVANLKRLKVRIVHHLSFFLQPVYRLNAIHVVFKTATNSHKIIWGWLI